MAWFGRVINGHFILQGSNWTYCGITVEQAINSDGKCSTCQFMVRENIEEILEGDDVVIELRRRKKWEKPGQTK